MVLVQGGHPMKQVTADKQLSKPVCELVYKLKAQVESTASRSIRIVYKIDRPVDLNFGVKF